MQEPRFLEPRNGGLAFGTHQPACRIPEIMKLDFTDYVRLSLARGIFTYCGAQSSNPVSFILRKWVWML